MTYQQIINRIEYLCRARASVRTTVDPFSNDLIVTLMRVHNGIERCLAFIVSRSIDPEVLLHTVEDSLDKLEASFPEEPTIQAGETLRRRYAAMPSPEVFRDYAPPRSVETDEDRIKRWDQQQARAKANVIIDEMKDWKMEVAPDALKNFWKFAVAKYSGVTSGSTEGD